MGIKGGCWASAVHKLQSSRAAQLHRSCDPGQSKCSAGTKRCTKIRSRQLGCRCQILKKKNVANLRLWATVCFFFVFFCSFHNQKVMSHGFSGTSSIGGVSPTAAAEGRNAAQQKVCGSWMPVSSLPPHLAQHHPHPDHHHPHHQQQHHNPAEQCGLWPHFRLAGGGVLTAHNGALFTCSEGPGPGLQTTLPAQWALLLFLFFLFLFFFFFSPSLRCLSLSGPRRSLPPALGTRGREGWRERWRR